MKKKSYSDLATLRERVKQKRQDYIRYDFSPKKNDVLKTFFDLAQEFDEIDDFYRICVVTLQESFQVECRLYIVNDVSNKLELVCDSKDGVFTRPRDPAGHVQVSDKSYEFKNSFFAPVRRNDFLAESTHQQDLRSVCIGVLEVTPLAKLTESDKFFLTKYTNRIGYNLRKKRLAEQNISHLKFIHNLVSDIEHNVIIPNMYFKHLFRQLRKKILALNELKKLIQTGLEESDNRERCEGVFRKITEIQEGLGNAYKEIDKHHANYSMFLESLLRRDHFEEGRFVLRNKLLNVEKDIIRPQLDHYRKRLLNRGISIKEPEDLKKENFTIKADLGLLAQVYANFFSNAVKYTQEIIDRSGQPRKVMAYGRKIISDYYGVGKPGVKLNVFTTGPHLSAAESHNIFVDGFKGYNSHEINSHGHGLSFVKMVVELHGGEVGHDFTEQGNNFFFILPLVRIHA